MLTLLKGAAYSQLGAHFKLPEDLQKKVVEFARRREPERAIYFLQDRMVSPECLREDKVKIERVLNAVRSVVKGISGPEDTGTLVANFEAVTLTRFEKPAWMSMEMTKIEN